MLTFSDISVQQALILNFLLDHDLVVAVLTLKILWTGIRGNPVQTVTTRSMYG